MPKPSSRKKSRTPPSDRRVYVAGLDAAVLVDLLDNHYDDVTTSPHRRLYAQTLAAFLKADGQEAVHFAALLENVDAMAGVEGVIRHAGFVQGFETCRQLILGELDLEALKTDGAQ